MNKSILIIGRPGSGKTTKAKEISNQFQKNEVAFIFSRGKKIQKDNFLFSGCTEQTKLVVFEELYDIEQVEAFYNPITVNKKMKIPFTISPHLVLVCQSEITEDQLVKLDASFYRRFEVVNLR